jgi:ribonuclease BN (tRNA processing enzyme)
MEKSIKILGSGGAIPFNGKAASSEICYVGNNEYILVDAGFGIAQSLMTCGEKMINLNSIFITHYHTDHISDLPTILFSYFLTTDKQSITIYTPKEEQDFIPNLFYKTYGHLAKTIEMVKGFLPKIEIVPITNENVSIGNAKIQTLQVKHGQIETFGLKIETPQNKIAISSDTTLCENLQRLTDGANILIQDCAFSDSFGSNPLHAIPSEVNQLIRESNSLKFVLLNHLMPDTIGKEAQLLETVQNNASAKVEFANYNQTL